MPFRLSLFVGLALLALAVLAAAPAAADVACGHQLSEPVMAKWQALGGEKGLLGCPTGDESVTATSQAGTRARQADFARGMIIWHASGSRAGQTFAITGCAYRLYFQYGGASGWLGLPTADAVNTPDGQRQSFEGGRVTFLRAPNDCGAERSAELTAAAPPAGEAPPLPDTSSLDTFFDPARGDHLTAAAASTARTALAANYQRVGPAARAFVDSVPGGAPLKLFWNETAGDHLTVATKEGEADAFARGYQFEASQGFVWTDPHPGAVALKQYQNGPHHWLVASDADEAQAKAQGFVFVRIEGYAPAP